MTKLRLAAALALLLAASLHAVGADWPQLLGPQRDGHQPVPTAGRVIEPRFLWEANVGEGFSGPIAASGMVILPHREGDEMRVTAFNETTGAVVWTASRPTDYVDGQGFNGGPRAVPAVADGRVFIHGADGVLDALELASGNLLWRVDTREKFQSGPGFFGRACSPLVLDDRVIITPGGRLDGKPAGVVALAADSGDLIWHAADDEAGYSSPALTGVGDLLCWMRNHLWVLDPASGAVRAKRHLRSRMDASVTTAQPLDLGDGTLLLTAEYGVGLHQLALPDLKQVWTAQRLLDCQYSTPLRRNRLLFGFHGMQGARQTLRCVDLDKRESLWLSPAVPGGHVVRTDDHLIAVTEQGEVWVQPLAAQAFDPEQQAQIMRAGHRSPPALSGGVLFARDADQLLAWRLFKMEGG